MRKGQGNFFDAAMTLAVTLIISAILIGLCVWYGPSIHLAREFTGVVELPLAGLAVGVTATAALT